MKPEAQSDPKPGDQQLSLTDVVKEFAEPLLALDPEGASDPDVLRQLMVLVDMCWNLPLLHSSDPDAYTKLKLGFDSVVRDVPGPVAEKLGQLLQDRTGRFGSLPFLVHTGVDIDSAGQARIVAEARKPR
jgi:hypothetical protein